jgi:hypothetical protein
MFAKAAEADEVGDLHSSLSLRGAPCSRKYHRVAHKRPLRHFVRHSHSLRQALSMGFAARLTAARTAQELQKGPITMDQTTKMIHEAITKAVQTNKLESICTAQEVLDTAKQLGRKWDMNSFCEKYAMPPQIAADLLQVDSRALLWRNTNRSRCSL